MVEIATINPMASIVGAILGAAISATVLLSIQKRKRLTFGVHKSEDLTLPIRKHHHFITFKISDKEVLNLNRGIVTVRNTGNVSVPDLTFEIVIPGDHKLNFANVETDNLRLRQSVSVSTRDEQTQYLDPLFNVKVPFLNPKETFSVQLFFDNVTSDCQVYCRMEDVRVAVRNMFGTPDRVNITQMNVTLNSMAISAFVSLFMIFFFFVLGGVLLEFGWIGR